MLNDTQEWNFHKIVKQHKIIAYLVCIQILQFNFYIFFFLFDNNKNDWNKSLNNDSNRIYF